MGSPGKMHSTSCAPPLVEQIISALGCGSQERQADFECQGSEVDRFELEGLGIRGISRVWLVWTPALGAT